MPVTKAAAKSLRQSKNHAARNATVKIQLRYLVKQVRKAVTAKKPSEAKEALAKAIKTIDKAAQNRVIPRNAANRTKSRLSKAVASLGKS